MDSSTLGQADRGKAHGKLTIIKLWNNNNVFYFELLYMLTLYYGE